jgi:hypothetical protein
MSGERTHNSLLTTQGSFAIWLSPKCSVVRHSIQAGLDALLSLLLHFALCKYGNREWGGAMGKMAKNKINI